MHFRWDNVKKLKTENDFVKPIVSPTMSGGLFAINRDFFTNLGEYDEGLDTWGGENLELSFRAWLCGGRLEILPCSRVGHVFRKRRPYGGSNSNGEDSVLRNSVRVAEVWLDEYKAKFYESNPQAKNVEYGDISSRIELRRKLNCKSFKWYLENIYPDMAEEGKGSYQQKTKFIPWDKRPRNYIKKFLLRLSKTDFCVESEGESGRKNSALVLGKCGSTKKKRQRWSETDKHELVLSELLCLDASSDVPKVSKCHELRGTQEWKRSGDKGTPIFSMAAGQCLGVKGKPSLGTQIQLVICDEKSERNKFDFVEIIYDNDDT